MVDDAEKPDKSKIVAMPLDRARKARGEGVVAMPRSKVASLRAFRRIRADRVFGLLGGVLVVMGVLLIFGWEKPPEVTKSYGVEWPLSIASADDRTLRFTAVNQPQNFTLKVAGPNVTAVVFWMNWTDDKGDQALDADNFSFELKGPPGANLTLPPESIKKLSENRSRTYIMSSIPEISSVNTDNEMTARRLVGDQKNLTGVGDYAFTFTLLELNHDWKDERFRDTTPCDVDTPYCSRDTTFTLVFHFHVLTYSDHYVKKF